MLKTPIQGAAEGMPNYDKHLAQLGNRQLIEQTIEKLVVLLDEIDGDPDFEANGDDEPWLGFRETPGRGEPFYDDGSGCELEDENDEDGGDDEPSLGSIETQVRPLDWHSRIPPIWLGGEPSGYIFKDCNADQTNWATGDGDDLELEEGNDEPSLGRTEWQGK